MDPNLRVAYLQRECNMVLIESVKYLSHLQMPKAFKVLSVVRAAIASTALNCLMLISAFLAPYTRRCICDTPASDLNELAVVVEVMFEPEDIVQYKYLELRAPKQARAAAYIIGSFSPPGYDRKGGSGHGSNGCSDVA